MSEDISGLGIWLVGYSAPKTNWGGIALTLADRADNVLARLLLEPRLAKGNVVFVAHSLGGLLVEQILRSADRDAKSDRRAEDFLARVRRIAFLGTPHRGALIANLATSLRVFFLRPSAATRDLLLGSPQLKDLNRWYRARSQAIGIEHLVLVEGRPERVFGLNLPETIGKVVWSDSADPGLPELSITVDESHTSICKPINREADVYVHLKDFIARPFVIPRGTRMEEAVENNTSQLKQLTTQSQEQTQAMEAFKRTVECRTLVPAMETAVIDAEVSNQVEHVRKCRFFAGFDTMGEVRRLVISLDGGALAMASSAAKSNALAWCARWLATSDPAESRSILHRITSPNQELMAIASALLNNGDGALAESLRVLTQIPTPMGLGAAYICVQKAKGFEEAEDWLQQTGLTNVDLDSDAKFFHLGSALEFGAWDKAAQIANTLTSADFDRSPAILRLAADAHLAQAIPDELRMLVHQYIPSNASNIPLRGDQSSLRNRRIAVGLYDQLASAAFALGMPMQAGDASDRALWLRLRDSEHVATARSELTASLKDPAVLLRRLNLAIQFGVEIDLLQVEKEVNRQTALSGGTSPIAAVARFSLALSQSSHAAAAEYVDKHRVQLIEHLDWKGVYFFEIEVLAKSGRVAQAEKLFQEAIAKGILPNEKDRLHRLLEEVAGNDPISGRLATYEKSQSIVDLRLLVDAYEGAMDWAMTAKYGKILLALTGDLSDAYRYMVALYHLEQLDEVLAVFDEYTDLVNQYNQASLLRAKTLFERGNINEARFELNVFRQSHDSPSARQLHVSMTIASGDWDSLQGFVENEWNNRMDRMPKELLRAGNIAHLIGATRGKDLVRNAAQRSEDDASTLVGCYQAAVSAGWEEGREASQWLARATALSELKDDGLIQKLSLEDIVERKPAWDKQTGNAVELLTKGDIPQFTFGQVVNRSLLTLFLSPALSNLDEPDVRRRPIVHAFSGARSFSALNPKVIAMDPTALISAELLGVFEIYISTFEKIIIPHNTLGWLLEEKAQILFHQPSRVAAAREILQMISNQHLHVFEGSSYASESLSREVGESLASLLTEVSSPAHCDNKQRLVVRGGPIHKVSTFMKEEADLGAFAPYLCSAADVVNKLSNKGVLTAKEASEAHEDLKLRELSWPSTPEIADGAILYLDDVTVSHLGFLRLLHKLHRADLTVILPKSEIEEAHALIKHDAHSAMMVKTVDGLRTKLKFALETGKVCLGRENRIDDEYGPKRPLAHPSVAMLRLIDDTEAGVVDDRFLNQHPSISTESSTKPLLTTVDLLDSLHRQGVISAENLLEARTALRRANYALTPLSQEELSKIISNAPIINGDLVETAELRIIRESVQRIRMSNLLQVPKELPWLDNLINVLFLVIKEQWTENLDETIACARSDWLLKLSDVRGWTHRVDEGVQQLENRYMSWLSRLMMITVTQSSPVKEAYWRWFGSRILNPMIEEDKKAYALLLDRAKNIFLHVVGSSASNLEAQSES
ncbi:esterase/lipase family protein [Comamonas koreensis]|uniref:HTH domain-containing protein n=1 Tax=Comamonas koreensis TaxID=160825 RepID=A0AAW4XX31_9BURK|nr:hypothetical protein [Comamonas koreensis]MCD2166238.1 hypothetical protein [Comamonas koreensis]